MSSPSNPAPSPARRRLLPLAAVAVGAAAAGAGYAWWKLQPHAVQAGAETLLWQRTFDTLGGASLAMASFKGKPLLINFWATWCPPCVEELPLLNGFYKQNASKGWQVLGLAIDQPSAVRNFLQKNPLNFPIALAGLEGTDLVKSLGNLAGGLPFTVLFGANGQLLHRKMGQVTAADLAQWASLS
jgi:thiol-disulfide isomerase/thioredoxin